MGDHNYKDSPRFRGSRSYVTGRDISLTSLPSHKLVIGFSSKRDFFKNFGHLETTVSERNYRGGIKLMTACLVGGICRQGMGIEGVWE
jgi:hypothetical protein